MEQAVMSSKIKIEFRPNSVKIIDYNQDIDYEAYFYSVKNKDNSDAFFLDSRKGIGYVYVFSSVFDATQYLKHKIAKNDPSFESKFNLVRGSFSELCEIIIDDIAFRYKKKIKIVGILKDGDNFYELGVLWTNSKKDMI